MFINNFFTSGSESPLETIGTTKPDQQFLAPKCHMTQNALKATHSISDWVLNSKLNPDPTPSM
jgi:hypothetical protein